MTVKHEPGTRIYDKPHTPDFPQSECNFTSTPNRTVRLFVSTAVILLFNFVVKTSGARVHVLEHSRNDSAATSRLHVSVATRRTSPKAGMLLNVLELLITVQVNGCQMAEWKPVALLLRVGTAKPIGEWVVTRDLLNYSSLLEKPKKQALACCWALSVEHTC